MTPPTVIRPPWPDELPRIAAAFPDLRSEGPLDPLVLIAPEPDERIVGVATINHPSDSAPARLQCVVRPRFADATARLLRAAVDRARAVGFCGLYAELPDSGNSPLPQPLAEVGFACRRSEELWQIQLATAIDRLAPIAESLLKRGAAAGLSAGPALPAHTDQIAALATAAHLLAPDRIRFTDTDGRGFDRTLSTVVSHGDRVVAAILVRRQPPNALVETRVAAPDHIGKANLPNALLLVRSMQEGQKAGLENFVLTANPASAAETIRMAQRFSGQKLRVHQFWDLRFG